MPDPSDTNMTRRHVLPKVKWGRGRAVVVRNAAIYGSSLGLSPEDVADLLNDLGVHADADEIEEILATPTEP